MELAKDYMIPDAQILDPFCGVGTMLIERQKVVKGILLMVSIILQKPLRKRSITQILQTRSFIISIRIVLHLPMTILLMKSLQMPYATGQKTEAEIREVYEKFFPFAKRVLGPEGTIIMYTRNREYVKQFAVKSNFRILKEIKITQRPESYLMILK